MQLDKLKIKKNNIISVSRRTDIPAFYGEWFLNRVKDGIVGYVNPFSPSQKIFVSLQKQDVIAFVFWSSNYAPFIPVLHILQEMGYKFYLHFTINGYPKYFENNIPKIDDLINTVKELGSFLDDDQIWWRYDPIIISEQTDYDFHLKNIDYIASKIHPYIKRCYFSFVSLYDKVKRSFYAFNLSRNNKIIEPTLNEKIILSNDIAQILNNYNITLYSCSNTELVTKPVIKRARCLDISFIDDYLYKNTIKHKVKKYSTRKDCGCNYAVDIGVYDSCPHGCIYCYANVNKEKALRIYKSHDPNSSFLGVTKEQSDIWINEALNKRNQNEEKYLF